MRDMLTELISYLKSFEKILILGFGKEGQSTLNFIKTYMPFTQIGIADKKTIQKHQDITLHTGETYLNCISDYDIIIKSPGISLKNINIEKIKHKITSQTDLFLQFFGQQTIGITGTKGKSTTTALLYHLLSHSNKKTEIAGNMGIPMFDILPIINTDSIIICELSSHQLQYIKNSPGTAVLLNIFEEHLDHYDSYNEYAYAKLNIAKYQKKHDTFYYFEENNTIQELLPKITIKSHKTPYNTKKTEKYFEKTETFPLKGINNKQNMYIAAKIAEKNGMVKEKIIQLLKTFEPLTHRQEYVTEINNIVFYNDSIATIPEATISAIEAIPNCQTLILGGYNRGINYDKLIVFLEQKNIQNFVLMGEVGKLLYKNYNFFKLPEINVFFSDNFDEIISFALKHTIKGNTCILSPAASSYDTFKNFEHRGAIYKEAIFNHKNNQ